VHRFSTDHKLFERFLETVFRVSGFDRFSLFERVLPFETESGFNRAEFLERFLKMVFRFSGFDRFSLFERVLPSDTESAEILGGDTFSPFDTESDF